MNKLLNKKKQITLILVLLSLIFIVSTLVFAYIGSFSRYLADDYCTAGKLRQIGFWESQIHWYTTWTGRYAFTFLVTLLELPGIKIVPILPLLYIIGFYFSTYTLVRTLFKQFTIQFPHAFQIFIAVFFVFITLFTVPNIGQDLYWMTGSATYFIPILIGFLLFSLLIHHTNHSNIKLAFKLFLGLSIFVIAWINSGFSEIVSVLQLIILAIVIFYQGFIQAKKQFNLLWLTAFAGTLIGTIIVIIAPGNAIRQTTYPPHPNLFQLITKTGVYAAKFTISWFVENIHIIWPAAFLLIIFSFAINKIFIHLPEQPIKKFKINILFLVIVIVFLVFISFLPSTWATSRIPWDRVLIFPTVLLVTMVSAVCILIGFILSDAHIPNPNHQGFISIVLTIFLLYFIIAIPVFEARKVVLLKPQAVLFANKWDERHSDILNQIEQNETHLKVIMVGYNLMELEHIQEDPSHWINICAAEYYGVKQISAIY